MVLCSTCVSFQFSTYFTNSRFGYIITVFILVSKSHRHLGTNLTKSWQRVGQFLLFMLFTISMASDIFDSLVLDGNVFPAYCTIKVILWELRYCYKAEHVLPRSLIRRFILGGTFKSTIPFLVARGSMRIARAPKRTDKNSILQQRFLILHFGMIEPLEFFLSGQVYKNWACPVTWSDE